jgi:CHAT domain-containing protein
VAEAAALVYVVGRPTEPITAFAVTGDSLVARVLPRIDSLESMIGRLVAGVEAGAGAEADRRALHRMLLGPVLAQLGTPRRLVIVVEGPLSRVPFAMLLDPHDRPLLERTIPVLAPSVAVFTGLRGRGPSAAARGILALADPTASPPRAGGLVASGRLPGARREAKKVARFADRSRVLVGGAATERAFRDADPGSYRVIHFAAHAVTEGSPRRAAIVLSPAGEDDGYLTAAEIGGLELAVDAVILSSCRSAGGAVLAGEGLQGLVWPLVAAGARAVIASHWDVDDRATTAFMTDVYDQVANGLPLADALAVAQRGARERGVSPAIWGAFTIVGDPLVGPPLRPPAPRLGWWLAALALLGVGWGFIGALRRRAGRP